MKKITVGFFFVRVFVNFDYMKSKGQGSQPKGPVTVNAVLSVYIVFLLGRQIFISSAKQ